MSVIPADFRAFVAEKAEDGGYDCELLREERGGEGQTGQHAMLRSVQEDGEQDECHRKQILASRSPE